MMTALGIGMIGIGGAVIYAAITGQSIKDELAAVLGAGKSAVGGIGTGLGGLPGAPKPKPGDGPIGSLVPK